MGQRLNLQIEYEGTPLANAYYHWSAYSTSAASLASEAVNAYYDIINEEPDINSVLLAVRMLEATGAGFNETEIKLLEVSSSMFLKHYHVRKSINRNEGLISITKEGMADTCRYEEGRVTLDLYYQKMFFEVFRVDSVEDFLEWNEDYTEEDINKLSEWEGSTYEVPFDEVEDFYERLRNSSEYCYRLGDEILCLIE